MRFFSLFYGRSRQAFFVLALFFWFVPGFISDVYGRGILLPESQGLSPLVLQSHDIDVQIKDQVAITDVVHIFKNTTNQDLEATFLFPLPQDAVITKFMLFVNGERIQGDLIHKTQARQIYEEVVGRTEDPGLLAYVGHDLFQARIFPILAHQEERIELRFEQVIAYDQGIAEYIYPLRMGWNTLADQGNLSLNVNISSDLPLKNIYSPSHEIGIYRENDRSARVSFKGGRQALDQDFVLYYTASPEDVGFHLLTFRRPDEAGYFLMTLSPRIETPQKNIGPKDVLFVLDTSGSMQGEKLARAKKALMKSLYLLQPHDRFMVISYATRIYPLSEKFLSATPENIRFASEFIQKLEAKGGSAILAALQSALRYPDSKERPSFLLLLSDGLPTVGEQETDKIVKLIRQENVMQTRIFPLGIGNQIHTHLFGELATAYDGVFEEMNPHADVEFKVLQLMHKISGPVLKNPSLTVKGVEIESLYPATLPDLFSGSQLILIGRYNGDRRKADITLQGTIEGRDEKFRWSGEFPTEQATYSLIERLWATRKMDDLLNEIRMYGENPKRRDDVIALSQAFGIATVYTSFIALPDETSEKMLVKRNEAGSSRMKGKDPFEIWKQEETDLRAKTNVLSEEKRGDAVYESQRMGSLKKAHSVSASRIRRINDKSFRLYNQIWLDRDFSSQMKTFYIPYGSKRYFQLLDMKPEFKEMLDLGTQIVLAISKDRAIIVSTQSDLLEPSEQELKRFLSGT